MGTARLNLPFIEVGQVQKEVQHNEALQLIDLLLHPSLDGFGEVTPPQDVVSGATYVIGADPVAEWTGYPWHLAIFTDGGWRFSRPIDGVSATMKSTGEPVRFVEGAWQVGVIQAATVLVSGKQVLGARCAPISEPSGGQGVDLEARRAIGEVLKAMREHGLIGL